VIVDCEVYYHGPTESPGGKGSGIDALDAMCREAGIDKAVLMPAPTFYPRHQVLADALGSPAGARGWFVGCALVNPHLGDDAIGELERAVKEWGFRAAKLMPTLHALNLVGRIAHPLMRKAQELGIPVTIHSAGSPAHPLEIGVLAEAFPRVQVIMDHMGYRDHVGAAIAAAKRTGNLYLMTTAVMEPHCIRDAVREIGAHRVVFGSNGPTVRPSTQIQVIRQAELAPDDERKVLGDNAAGLLRL